MLSGWRVTSFEFASTPREMMSGEGAYLYGGRWNSKGVRLVYLGSSLAQAAMEMLVHISRSDILKKSYVNMEVQFDESMVQHISLNDLPENWMEQTMESSVQEVGDQWATNKSSLILQVPSAAVPGEYNYLFNPLHHDADKVTFGPITPFKYDSRVLK